MTARARDPSRGPRLALGCLILALGGGGGPGCVGTSQNIRPRVLMPGQLRLGVAQGVTRNVADDYFFAEPSTETATAGSWASLTELSIHYGVVRDFDLGLRLRPLSYGGKVEALYQLVRGRPMGVGLAIGFGADGFYRPRTETACVGDGCFYHQYQGVVGDLPLVLSWEAWRHGVLFVALRYQHLLIKGHDTYRSKDGTFVPIRTDRTFQQPIGGWSAGVMLEGRYLRVMVQVCGATLRLPDQRFAHTFYPSVELAWAD